MAKKVTRAHCPGLWNLDLKMPPARDSRSREIVEEMDHLESLLKSANQGSKTSKRGSGRMVEKRGANTRRLTRLEEQHLRHQKMKQIFISLVLLAVLVGMASYLSQLLKV
jgi:hypothetical protein